MNKNLVTTKDIEIINNELYIGSFRLSQMFEVEHRSFKRTIQNNIKEVNEMGVEMEGKDGIGFVNSILETRNAKLKKKVSGGRPVQEYLLNEPQATFAVLLLRGQYKTLEGKKKVVQFKQHLTTMFFKQRKLLNKLLVQKQNADWLQKREEGKLERRLETDTIKDFIEYAKGQGSKNSEKYYMLISRMENHTLFSLNYLAQRYPNIRDIAQGFQLTTLQTADMIVAKALKEGMEEKLHYKDIYLKAKENVEQFVKIIGKTPLQIALEDSGLAITNARQSCLNGV